jgi:hypothetical protein
MALQTSNGIPGSYWLNRTESAPARPSPERTDLVELGVLWQFVRQRLRFVFVFGVVVTVVVYVLSFALGPGFLATGQLYLGEVEQKPPPAQGTADGFDMYVPGGSAVASEVAILQSRSLIRRAILDSGLNVSVSRAGRGGVSYLTWLLSGRDASLIDGPIEEIRPTSAALPATVLKKKRFRVTFRERGEYDIFAADDTSLGHGTLGHPLATDALSLTLEQAGETPPRAGTAYDLTVYPLDRAIDDAAKNLKVKVPKDGSQRRSCTT